MNEKGKTGSSVVVDLTSFIISGGKNEIYTF